MPPVDVAADTTRVIEPSTSPSTSPATAVPGATLDPALVVSAEGGEVIVELPGGGEERVTLALAYLYQPVPGDVLLVASSGARRYAIGVLHSTGKVALAFRGDVEVRAVDGHLRLSGDRGVSVEGPAVEVHTSKLKVIADSLVERFDSVYRRVTSLLHVHAGRAHTAVDGPNDTQAESVTVLTKEVVTINGKQIQLG
ncbi:MAG: DUF3540 domain-containing protein [Polyangiaceae bacterium]